MKKILLMLALMLPCLGAWAQIQTSTKTDAPENLYKIKSKTGYYMAAHSNPTTSNYGRFAFYAVDGKENTYKIYSYDADLWLSYTKADGYNNGMNFVSFEQTQESANEWYVAKVGDYYQVAPYNTSDVASKYWNFYGNINSSYYSNDDYRNTLGLYSTGADKDNGSAWTLEAVAAGDYTAPTTLNYELTDGNGNVYTGTYTGVAGRTRLFTHQNTLCPITDVTFDGNTYKANITFPIPVSNTETTNKLMINGYNSTSQDFKWYVKDDTYIKVNENSAPTLETINDYLWAIYPTFNEGKLTFTIKNIATEKFITSTTLTAAHGDNTLGLADTGVAFELVNNRGYAFKVTNKTLYLSINSSKDDKGEQPVGLHGSLHDGTSVGFIPYVINYTLTDTEDNTYTGKYEGWSGFQTEPTFTGVEGYELTNKSWSGNTFTATIDFNLPTHLTVSSETTTNLITIGQGTWSNQDAYAKLWTVVDGNVKVVNGTPTLGTAQWMVYPTLNGTKIGFKIKSASTGKYVTANLGSGNDAEAIDTPVTLTAEGTEFSYISTTCGFDKGFAYTNNNGATMFLTRNGENDNNALLGVYQASNNHEGSGLRFPEFNQYKVVIGDAGYTTVYAPFTALTNDWNNNEENLLADNVVEIYSIAAQEVVNDKVQLTQMSYYIPAGSAAILKSNKGTKGTYVFTKSNDDEEDYNAETQTLWAQNVLKGSSVNTIVEGEAYVLGNKSKGVALYLAELDMDENGKDGNTHFLNNAGKAYLPKDAISVTSLALSFNFGGNTTAIESVLNNGADANAPIYDLTGRRVMNTVKGGIYIQNGKKFIVK